MKTLYPELFRILWQSTLPCFKVKLFIIILRIHSIENPNQEEGVDDHLLLDCQLAGTKVDPFHPFDLFFC